jgi:hypothetical protein
MSNVWSVVLAVFKFCFEKVIDDWETDFYNWRWIELSKKMAGFDSSDVEHSGSTICESVLLLS